MSPQKKRPNKKAPVVCRSACEPSPSGSDEVDEWENLKRLTRQQLEFAGWIDEVETQCRLIAAEHAGDARNGRAVRHEQLLEGVREPMLRSVPDHIKARVLKDIKDKLLAPTLNATATEAE